MTATGLHGKDVQSCRNFVLVSTIVVLVISNASYALRIWARKKSNQVLQLDDWMMACALPFSYIPAVCLLYGLTVGLGEHQVNVSAPDLRKFNISLFVLQRGNPPCMFFIKTSILLLYVRIFHTPTFRKVALGVWVFTACWAVSAFTSNLLQCYPVSYFWNKNQPGHCIPHALITIGMTNGVLSFVGDLVILLMPLAMIWKLQMDRKRKIALSGIFLLGSFVCVTSILRFVAIASIDTRDITYTQVDPGVWTYIELGIGITSGNLPLLRPLLTRWLRSGSSSNSGASSTPLPTFQRGHQATFGRIPDKHADVESLGSQVELTGITVMTDLDLTVEEVGGEEEGVKETRRLPMPKNRTSKSVTTSISASKGEHF